MTGPQGHADKGLASRHGNSRVRTRGQNMAFCAIATGAVSLSEGSEECHAQKSD